MKHAHRILIALALSLATYRAEAQPGTEEVGTHGMLVVGSETLYASHLPMFMPQHRYQGIWEISFGAEGDKVYRTERALPDNAKLIFTLVPTEDFRLPELTQTRKSFRADIFRGHFERGGQPILEDVKVTVRRQVHWHPFRNSHERPEPLTYLLFGKGKELFLAHWISLAPNYDQILSVTPSKPLGEIPEGAQLVIAKRSDGDALKAGESVSGVMIVESGPEQPFTVTPVDLKVGSVIYLEKGELEKNVLADGK
ncbi:MAG TPA: hypothetical protein VF179_12410 [Thermoanaerobaculia bacterium]|nr:hypothetical protein [Thermoanaerobaculia bacterium]